ncbi:MAG: hypothetical protein E4H08_01865 [Candidatus Atribacteria bacterium]|nr:MAG: hypothetical protein E4H08_01865 [Candidatus Atribacteria bacterium]
MMSRYGWVGCVSYAMVLVFAVTGVAASDDLSLDLDASGFLDARLCGLAFSATIEGEGFVAGTADCGDEQISLASESTVYGVGFYNILSQGAKAWLLSVASGMSSDEQDFSVRSLAFIARQTLTPLKSGDIFEGVHHTVIQMGGMVHIYWGRFSGTLAGGISLAGTGGGLQLTGSGVFHLSGERIEGACAADLPTSIPLDDPELPADFLRAIAEAFH